MTISDTLPQNQTPVLDPSHTSPGAQPYADQNEIQDMHQDLKDEGTNFCQFTYIKSNI